MAEERCLDHDIEPSAAFAIEVQADFMHESRLEEDAVAGKARKRDRVKVKMNAMLGRTGSAPEDEKEDSGSDDMGSVEGDARREPFKLGDIVLSVPRGQSSLSGQDAADM